MRVLRVFDSEDYDPSLPRTVRNAVRAVIARGEKLLLVRSDKFGEYKFPGGGVEGGETHAETLLREVREETGLNVIPASIREYGMTVEIRRDRCGGVFEQNSFYYLCEVEDAIGERRLDEYEEEYGYRLVEASVDEAIAANAPRLGDMENIPWALRELFVLGHVKENLFR